MTYQSVVSVDSPDRDPGSCNCACDESPDLVVRLGTTNMSQSTRLCTRHAYELYGALKAFLEKRDRFRFRRQSPRIES